MRRLQISLFALLLIILGTSLANAQFGVYIGGGTTWYYGDMNDRILTHRKLFRYYVNGGVLYRFSPRVDVLANFTFGKIAGADSLAIQDFNLKRNLDFESTFWEASLFGNFHILRNGSYILNPYIIAGIGYMHFDPKSEFNGEKIALQPLGTEGQYINGGGYPKPYKLYSLTTPLGIGVEIPLSNVFKLRVEYSNHFTFTDYLDDLSANYADSTALAATPNGIIAVQMASNLETGYPAEGYGRGNSNRNDSFSTLGVTLLIMPGAKGDGNSGGGRGKGVFGKKKKKAACPAFD